MTVSDLIEVLQRLPPNAEVMYRGGGEPDDEFFVEAINFNEKDNEAFLE